MTIEREYSTKLTVEGVTIDRRDIEMLDAIERCGSMHSAAAELGRSYARVQNRLVELEETLGTLTERRRGGVGGGGTELTPTADELRRRFDRHDAELDGVSHATESVFEGQVRDRNGELATVETDAGAILALVPMDARTVQVAVRSDAVVLTDPDDTPHADGTSLRNQFTGTVEAVDAGDAVVKVTVRLGADRYIEALVTETSRSRLELEPDRAITASFKATAARGIRIDRSD